MIPYAKIFRQAIEITRNNKFLWIFGPPAIASLIISLKLAQALRAGLFLSLATTFIVPEDEPTINNISPWIFIAVLIIFLVIYFRCKAALMIAIKSIIDQKEITIAKAFKPSQQYFLQLMGVYFMIQVAIGLLGMVMYLPIRSMFDAGNTYAAVSFTVVGLLIFIPFALAAVLYNVIVPMFIVIFGLKYNEALKRTSELLSKHWQTLLVVGFLMFLPQLLILLASLSIVFFQDLPYHMIGLAGIIGTGLLLLLAHAILAVFQQAVWVLTFLELVRPQKFEEEVPEVAPEIAG
ncbi:MAG: hypothetical protein A3I07_03710 [Candidatus Doudnabacteria bacterium RIFCSPLOWO2_02_FULL_42_9]|uniref:Glycerophosphoryl diester phosphodiesterase membrane domain-containing protein n=1 Tax=Candidatus Doudnabacteria bacterium RIFCSPHIGHO2_01_FULL_41_86 TaxID=1817821 RepID=A0A1F5N8T8_9BACT|nr:MAG: hypothetical protein A2717_00595 [Candidatus Doudnabacteria bacterium RIFCSPHIGHO2_01_FULL_41_86]OGE75778.1 MAG: hypothetical protein A3K07_03460 [Candidatus Doudnabacteria bacterium RIFCSPHIGHO2_01_43_10]OGE86440.1 MAG: hypothetical protein A3E28_00470 [Candidatus Doudnabacteria bacterium RIFCSPHIGHO2_12_FULL_42_22]OGE87439.1 MAG: hypothetical protein A3C49_04455 [Candidatus Doudnabacteria bacterium RIFCSPHIGHO2_02_FULL_42_25]OGE92737.1 MAG: hypothetical protein A2895_03950 [Candidatus